MKLLLILATSILAASVQAGTDNSKAVVPMTTAPAGDGWWFRGAPYVWLTAVDGDVGVGPLSAPVDISIADTLESVDMAFMGLFEAGYGRLSVGVDVVYAKLSQDIGGGGHLFDSFRFEQKQWLLTPFVAYNVVKTERYHMDVFLGAQITILEVELTGRLVGPGEIVASRDKDWIDPIIGIRGQAEITEKLFFRYNGEIGGFGVSSDLVWEAFLGFGCHINENVSVAVGYRGLGIDYSSGGFTYDTVSHGPVIGLEVRF